MKNYRLVFVSVLLLLASCSNKEVSQDDQMGELRVNMVTDQDIVSRVSDAHKDPTLTPDMFTMEVQNPQGEHLRDWSYTDMPSPMRLNAGDYRMVAWYGSKELPAWNTPYYAGFKDFTVVKDQLSQIDIVCKPAAVKVKVLFDDSFSVRYSAYAVRIRTGAADAPKYLPYDPTTQTKAGYFAEGPMYMLFVLTSKVDGKVTFHQLDQVIQTKARESYIFTLTASVVQGFDAITITTDQSTDDKEPIDIIISKN